MRLNPLEWDRLFQWPPPAGSDLAAYLSDHFWSTCFTRRTHSYKNDLGLRVRITGPSLTRLHRHTGVTRTPAPFSARGI